MLFKLNEQLVHPSASWLTSCPLGPPAWYRIGCIINEFATVGEVEAALRRIASGEGYDPVPAAAAGALMWGETMLLGSPKDALFGDAVSRLAQSGAPIASRLEKVRQRSGERGRGGRKNGAESWATHRRTIQS